LSGLGDAALRLRDEVAGGRTAIAVKQGGWLVDFVAFSLPGSTHIVDEEALAGWPRSLGE
jgi:hypothetical protein